MLICRLWSVQAEHQAASGRSMASVSVCYYLRPGSQMLLSPNVGGCLGVGYRQMALMKCSLRSTDLGVDFVGGQGLERLVGAGSRPDLGLFGCLSWWGLLWLL